MSGELLTAAAIGGLVWGVVGYALGFHVGAMHAASAIRQSADEALARFDADITAQTGQKEGTND
jgi:hypothetical protein